MSGGSLNLTMKRKLLVCASSAMVGLLVMASQGSVLAQGQTQTPKAQATTPNPIGTGANWQANVSTQTPATNVTAPDIELVTKVNDYFNKMTDLQGIFLQTDPDNKQHKGRFYFEKPGKVRFEYAPPSKLMIISDGKYLAVEDHDLNTTDRYPLDMTPFRLLLSQPVDLATDARIIAIDQGPDTTILTLEDKKSDTAGRIRLFFSKPDLKLKQWVITDPSGLDTRVEVSNVEENKPVPAATFEFTKGMGFNNNN